MKLADTIVKDIEQLALYREVRELSRDETIELFDSIDCLDADELNELCTLVLIGQLHDSTQLHRCIEEARGKGFAMVNELFAMKKLGSYLKCARELTTAVGFNLSFDTDASRLSI